MATNRTPDGGEGQHRTSTKSTPRKGLAGTSAISDSERVITSDLDYCPSMSMERLTVAAFNRLNRDMATALVQPCFGVKRWWTAVVANRPYLDLNGLLE